MKLSKLISVALTVLMAFATSVYAEDDLYNIFWDFEDGKDPFKVGQSITGVLKSSGGIYDTGDEEYGKAYKLSHTSGSNTDSYTGGLLTFEKIPGKDGVYEISYDIKVSATKWTDSEPYTILGIYGWIPENPATTYENGSFAYWETHLTLSVMGGVEDAEGRYLTYSGNGVPEDSVKSKVMQNNGEWYNVRIIMDTDENKADYYYNGVFAGTQERVAAARNEGTPYNISSQKQSLQFTIRYGIENETCDMYIDNLRIKKLSEDELAELGGESGFLKGVSLWARDEVLKAYESKLTYDEILNNYIQDISRAEFCRLVIKLYKKIGGEEVKVSYKDNPFIDCGIPDVILAHKLGIVNGTSSDRFSPANRITRQEIACMLYRMVKLAGESLNEGDLTEYSDSDKVAAWAIESLEAMNSMGIITGVSDTEISPQTNATREQAILMSYRLFNKIRNS